MDLELRKALERIAALERKLAGGNTLGNSVVYGQQVARPVQLGFEAELTGPWNASTNYPWKRKQLIGTPLAFADTDIPIAGQYAVASNNDETLTAGTYGWMEPSPDGTGWIFVQGGTGSGGSGGSGSGETITLYGVPIGPPCPVWGTVSCAGSGG